MSQKTSQKQPLSHSLRQRLSSLLVILLVAATLLSGCGGKESAPSAPVEAPAPVQEAAAQETTALDLPVDVDAQTVEQIRSRDDVVILDVREDWEFAEGHIPDALWIPLGEIPQRVNEIPKDKTVVAVCRSGNRSSRATAFLRQNGFDNVHNMLGGMIAWEKSGYEIAKGQ